MAEDISWKTTSFRQSVVNKINEAIQQSGMNSSKNGLEMENHVFLKARNKDEYLSFVARLILHVREMNSKSKNQQNAPGGSQDGGGGNPNQQQGPGIQDPINALQNLASQGTRPQMMGGGGGGQMGGPGPGGSGAMGDNESWKSEYSWMTEIFKQQYPHFMTASLLTQAATTLRNIAAKAPPGGEVPPRVEPNRSGGASIVKIGIIPLYFPLVTLTRSQMKEVQRLIINKIIQRECSTVNPKFHNCRIKPGFLVLNCKNKETSEWIKTITPELSSALGVELEHVRGTKIPRLEVLIGCFPRSVHDSTETILHLIEAQNDELDTSAWRVLDRSRRARQHAELCLVVDEASMSRLQELNFVVHFKFGCIKLVPRKPRRKKISKNN